MLLLKLIIWKIYKLEMYLATIFEVSTHDIPYKQFESSLYVNTK